MAIERKHRTHFFEVAVEWDEEQLAKIERRGLALMGQALKARTTPTMSLTQDLDEAFNLKKLSKKLERNVGAALTRLAVNVNKEAVSNFDGAYRAAQALEPGSIIWREPNPAEVIATEENIGERDPYSEDSVVIRAGAGRLDRLNRSARSDVRVMIDFDDRTVNRVNSNGVEEQYTYERKPLFMNIRGATGTGTTESGVGEFGVAPTEYKFWKFLEWGGQIYPGQSEYKRVQLVAGRGSIRNIEVVSTSGGRDSAIRSQGKSLFFMSRKAEWWARFGGVVYTPPSMAGFNCLSQPSQKYGGAEFGKEVDEAIRKTLEE